MSTPKPKCILTAFAQCLAITASALTTTPAMAQAILSSESEASTNIEVLANFIVNASDLNFGTLIIPGPADTRSDVNMVCDGGNVTPSSIEPSDLIISDGTVKCGVFSVTSPMDGLHFRLTYSVDPLVNGLSTLQPDYTVYDSSGSSVIKNLTTTPPIQPPPTEPNGPFAAGSAGVPMSFYIGGSLSLFVNDPVTDTRHRPPPGEYIGRYQVIATIIDPSP